MKIPVKRTVDIDAKVLKIHLKVRDEFCADLVDASGEKVGGIDMDYVPKFMPGRKKRWRRASVAA